MLLRLLSGLLFFTLLAEAQATPESPPYEVKQHYTKYEYSIPMRDGVKLFTSVYIPKDDSKRYPFLMQRTPYSVAPYGVDQFHDSLGPSVDFAKAGYIFVYQDVRGRHRSEGKFIDMTPHIPVKRSNRDVDESTDTFDSVEWLLKNIPNHNGKVGLWGISYPGFYVAAGIIDTHPAIKAASPQAPVIDMYMNDDSYHGGAFMLAASFGFYTFFKTQANPVIKPKPSFPFDYETRDGYEFFLKHGTLANLDRLVSGDEYALWRANITHDTYDDFWKARNLAPHLKNIKTAVLTVGGWFDSEDPQGPLSAYQAIEKNNPGIRNMLVMGPWIHGGWERVPGERIGMVNFQVKNRDYFMKNIALPFFEQQLRDKPDPRLAETKLAKVQAFETGTNVWRQYPEWPPQAMQPKALYFHAGGKLDWQAPSGSANAFDEYRSDPAKPVPFIAYTALNVPQEYVVGDQRFASTRPDVLVYQTDVLEQDVTLAGPINAKLFVSTTGTDSDWVVKLIDVYPAELEEVRPRPAASRPDVAAPAIALSGYQQLVRGEPLRGKFRNSFEKPEPFTPGKVEAVNVKMPDIHHTFRRGHRIMVQVQSSWFPLIDRNPQTFVRIPTAKPEDFKAAQQRVYRGAKEASSIVLPIMPTP
ncbi:MAG: CocE/NonD family hydrolase [Betaproteobacteria bacterium]|nr:CocE/NonD family hydrolase [Betaproteobacteria bacterium]